MPGCRPRRSACLAPASAGPAPPSRFWQAAMARQVATWTVPGTRIYRIKRLNRYLSDACKITAEPKLPRAVLTRGVRLRSETQLATGVRGVQASAVWLRRRSARSTADAEAACRWPGASNADSPRHCCAHRYEPSSQRSSDSFHGWRISNFGSGFAVSGFCPGYLLSFLCTLEPRYPLKCSCEAWQTPAESKRA